jgi:hypothetical protein
MEGTHPRRRGPVPGGIYVAGLDVAGGDDVTSGTERDASVLTIGELGFSACNELVREPGIRIVEHYRWRGLPHNELLPQLLGTLRNRWSCRRVAVDATGIGHSVASFLEKALGRNTVTPFAFTAQSKSRLGYELIAAVNTGRVRMYARDGSSEWAEFWQEVAAARAQYRTNRTLNYFVEESRGHDDYLASLALLVEASKYLPRVARGRSREALQPA